MTLFERMQRVQARIRRTPPLTMARTRWRLGSNRRGRTLLAWLKMRPTVGTFPQISHCLAMSDLPNGDSLSFREASKYSKRPDPSRDRGSRVSARRLGCVRAGSGQQNRNGWVRRLKAVRENAIG